VYIILLFGKKLNEANMVYDIFQFAYELDLLEIRLNILDPYVDKFVICESTTTFMLEPKKLWFEENKERFAKWNHKIIHHIIDDFPNDKKIYEMAKSSFCVGAGEMNWVNEFYQKESARKALVGLDDEDICYIGDLDEIWRPNMEMDLDKTILYRPTQTHYLYYLNNRTDGRELWTGTIVLKYKHLKNECLNHMLSRKYTQSFDKRIENGGWHFEAFGGVNGAKTKMEVLNYSSDYNLHRKNELGFILQNNLDYKGRNLRIGKDNSGLPEYILNNEKLFKEKGWML
jgi:beta-1,4-mannosyl-glycoprotein beta-1,4-N-acetylglucosaminyltransferase